MNLQENEPAPEAAAESRAPGNRTAIDEALKPIGASREGGARAQSRLGRMLPWIYIISALALAAAGRLLDQGLIPAGTRDPLVLQRLNVAVYNYSWPLFPYIWNEVRVHMPMAATWNSSRRPCDRRRPRRSGTRWNVWSTTTATCPRERRSMKSR